ncbi:MAG: DUF502 domain-containing protein [Verrucomicrobiota bacterium]
MPIVVTAGVIHIGYEFINAISAPIYRAIGWNFVGLPFLTTILIVLGMGVMVRNVFGRRIIEAFESLILSVPLVSPVYGVVKQTLESIRSMRDSGNFRRVAYIKYPEGNGLLVGFVTGQCYDPAFDKEFTLIFLPLTPNPASGRVIAVPGEEGIASGLTVEQVMKIVLSGGGWWHPHGRRTRSPNKFRGLFEQTHPTLRLMRKDLVSP